jgi:hypothetical protein
MRKLRIVKIYCRSCLECPFYYGIYYDEDMYHRNYIKYGCKKLNKEYCATDYESKNKYHQNIRTFFNDLCPLETRELKKYERV